MKIIDLQQGTSEWHQFRKEGIGSSDIAKLLHSTPFSKAWKELKRQKLGKAASDFQTEAMKEGKIGEVNALIHLETQFPNIAPQCAVHDEVSYIRCSFDAIYQGVPHEIKSPQIKNLERCLMHSRPEEWEDQLRWQMYIADAPVGYLQIWDGAMTHPFEYERDYQWELKALKTATQFWNWVQDGVMPDDDYVLNDREDKAELMCVYSEKMELLKALKEETDAIKEKIVAGEEADFILNGVKCFQSANTTYDYKKMVTDFNISLEEYKKQSKPFWKIAL